MSNIEHLGKFKLRHTTEADIDRVCDFYVHNTNDFNAYRSLERMQAALARRFFFVIESERDHTIHACAGIFVHDNGGLVQAAASRVPGSKSVGGFGVHLVLHRARALHAKLMLKDPMGKYFAAIDVENDRSIGNALSIGFEEWREPPPTLSWEALSLEKGGLSFFRLPQGRIKEYAQWFMNHPDGIRLERTHRESGEQQSIDLSFQLEPMMYYRHLVEALC